MSSSKPQHRLLADECVYQATVEFLRESGYDVLTVQELGLGEAKDIAVIQQAAALGRALLTRDLDFSSILDYPPARYLGIVILKMTPQTVHAVHSVLSRALSEVQELRHTLLIVDRNKYHSGVEIAGLVALGNPRGTPRVVGAGRGVGDAGERVLNAEDIREE